MLISGSLTLHTINWFSIHKLQRLNTHKLQRLNVQRPLLIEAGSAYISNGDLLTKFHEAQERKKGKKQYKCDYSMTRPGLGLSSVLPTVTC